LRGFAKSAFFLFADILQLALRKAIDKYGHVTTPKEEDGAIPARFALSRTSHPLLDDAATKIGIHQTVFREFDRSLQNRIADPLLPRNR